MICGCLWMWVGASWWRHQMETFSALLVFCAGNSPVTGEFTAQRPVAQSFDVLFDLRLNKRFTKQSCGWWFETPSRPLWRRCNVLGVVVGVGVGGWESVDGVVVVGWCFKCWCLYVRLCLCVRSLAYVQIWYIYFLHARPWIPGDEKSIFTVVIH